MLKNTVYELKEKCVRNKAELSVCLLSTFLWGLTAHAYMFLSNSLSHDSLNEFYAKIYGNEIRIAYGRIFVPLYRFFARSAVVLPWLIGLLALLFIAAAVFFTVKIFGIRSKTMIFFTAGIFTVNVTVIATAATYIQDLDCNMLSLLFAAAAVYIWKTYKYGWIYGAVPVMLSLGIYQSYISVSVTLIMFCLILGLLSSVSFKETMLRGVKSAAMLISGGILYAAAVKAVCFVTKIPLAAGDYSSLDRLSQLSLKNVLTLIINRTERFIPAVRFAKTVFPAKFSGFIALILIIITFFFLLKALISRTAGIKEILLTVILLFLLPAGMNIAFVLSNGRTHDVMIFAYWLIYLFALIISSFTSAKTDKREKKLKIMKNTALLCTAVILWGNVQTANTIYTAKKFEYDATLSLLTRVTARMEELDFYKPGETPVVFVGKPDATLVSSPAFDSIRSFTGAETNYALGVSRLNYYKAYFAYVLMNPALMADQNTWNNMRNNNSEVKAMPCWPDKDSLKLIDGVLIVKLGENN